MTRTCLETLAWTCNELEGEGVSANAVVVASDENLYTAADLGFATVDRVNSPLGRKWNDGYELACRHGGADYVVAVGSDDWVHPDLILAMLDSDATVRSTRLSSVVSEDGCRLAPLRITYEGGDGVRMIAAETLRPLRYRPIEEDRDRAMDTSCLRRVKAQHRRVTFSYHDMSPWFVVDWKSRREQLNSYDACLEHKQGGEHDPWTELAGVYPDGSLESMRAVYRLPRRKVAA